MFPEKQQKHPETLNSIWYYKPIRALHICNWGRLDPGTKE